MNRPAVALVVACVLWGCTAAAAGMPAAEARRAVAAAAAWLWSQQAEDGGWHSTVYRQLAGGRALTPLVLDALAAIPDGVSPAPPDRRRRAVDFIRRHVDAAGVVGLDDPRLPEYPTYATALAVKCLVEAGAATDVAMIDRCCGHLQGAQFGPARGLVADHLATGGWGFGGPLPVGGAVGHVDLAHTRHALEAIRAARRAGRKAGPGDDAVMQRARMFLAVLQRHPDDARPQPSSAGRPRPAGWRPPFDGGFYFSPVVFGINKGREGEHDGQPYFRSYATATCEGVLALLASGAERDDDRVTAAAAWLRAHPRLDYPQGVPEGQPEAWGESIFFYHLAVRARTYAALGWPGPWRDRIAAILAAAQQPDGSFRNAVSTAMKEDDPLLATALAVTALAESCR